MPLALNLSAQAGKNIGHNLNVRNVRNIMNNAFAAAQKRCSKQFKCGILRAGYVNFAGKCVITPNYDDLFRHRNHPSSVVVCSTFQCFHYTKKPAGLTRRASCLRDRFAREKFSFGLRGSLVPRNSASFCSCRCASTKRARLPRALSLGLRGSLVPKNSRPRAVIHPERNARS